MRQVAAVTDPFIGAAEAPADDVIAAARQAMVLCGIDVVRLDFLPRQLDTQQLFVYLSLLGVKIECLMSASQRVRAKRCLIELLEHRAILAVRCGGVAFSVREEAPLSMEEEEEADVAEQEEY